VSWITLKTTGTRWEAELMQQMLEAHQIPARVINQGIAPHFGCGTPAALQVRLQDQWTALLLLSPIEKERTSERSNDEPMSDEG
jgi:hypothetical protein